MEKTQEARQPMSLEETKRIVEKVEGWLSHIEGQLLYNLAKNCKGKGVIVEIGSWKGKSTIWLGKGSKEGNKVQIYAIDPHTGSSEHRGRQKTVRTYEEFKNNIRNAGVDDIVIPIVKTSEEAARGFGEKVEFIFIDGAHEYETVKSDFELWFPKLINGGTMAFHDTIGFSGPKKVVEKSIYRSRYFKNAKFVDLITYAQKVKQNSFRDRLRNNCVLLLMNLYDFGHRLNLPMPITTIGNRVANLVQ